MTIDDKDKLYIKTFLSNPEISNAIDELAIDDLLSKMKMFVSDSALNIKLSTVMELYEDILQLIVDDVGGQYFIDNIKSNNPMIHLSSLSFDSPIAVKDDRFVFRFCEFNKGITFDCGTINLSALDMSTVYGNLVLTDKCKLIYNKALNISSKSVCDIYIPKSVKRIGKLSPNAYTNDVRIIYEGSRAQFSQIDSNNLIFDSEVVKNNLIFENK